MKGDFLGAFIGNTSRARIVRVFIFNQSQSYTAAQLTKRSGVKGKAIMQEIKFLEQLGVIRKGKSENSAPTRKSTKTKQKKKAGKVKLEPSWSLNPEFRHMRALSTFVHEVSPIQYGNIVPALKNSGRLSVVLLSGCFTGDLTRPVDLVVAGDNLNESRIEQTIKGFEPIFGREIRYSTFGTSEFRYRLTVQDHLIRDTLDYPHVVLLDRMHLL